MRRPVAVSHCAASPPGSLNFTYFRRATPDSASSSASSSTATTSSASRSDSTGSTALAAEAYRPSRWGLEVEMEGEVRESGGDGGDGERRASPGWCASGQARWIGRHETGGFESTMLNMRLTVSFTTHGRPVRLPPPGHRESGSPFLLHFPFPSPSSEQISLDPLSSERISGPRRHRPPPSD